ncbi:hypothetical protein ACJ4JD_002513 [Escherichia coli]
MFDFPQPGEIYRSAGFPDVAVVGILEDGIPWEMPYRCPDIVWKRDITAASVAAGTSGRRRSTRNAVRRG